MTVTINPKDTNTFASACVDRTVKVWSLGSSVANFTLEGHEKGVNWVDYYYGGEKPYLVTAGDDQLVKIWDYQNKTCVQTLEGHSQNATFAVFHPELPIIISGSEDGSVKIWHANTYRLENTLNYGLNRAWAIAYRRSSNDVALGFDHGSVVIKVQCLIMDICRRVISHRKWNQQRLTLHSYFAYNQYSWVAKNPLSAWITAERSSGQSTTTS
jgi:coatomer subunit beta'